MNAAELEGAITALTFAYLDLVRTLDKKQDVRAATLAATIKGVANASTSPATKAYFQVIAKKLVL